MYRKTSAIAVLLAVLLLLLQGCATLSRLSAVPLEDTIRATVPGIPNARFWVDADLNPLIPEYLKEFEREEVEWTREGHRGSLPPAHYLAIAKRVRKAYVIRNARLDPDWATVERSTLTIAGHAISALIQTQGTGDLYRLYLLAQKDGLDFNLAYIGADFTTEHKEDFDPAYMRALFDYGYQLGRKSYPWQKTPPGLTATRSP